MKTVRLRTRTVLAVLLCMSMAVFFSACGSGGSSGGGTSTGSSGGSGSGGTGTGGNGGGEGGSSGGPVLTSPLKSVSPAQNATSIAITSLVSITFDTDMDGSSITQSTFTLSTPSGPMAASVAYDSSTKTATLTPFIKPDPLASTSTTLVPLTKYTAALSTGVKTASGTPLASAYSWSFSTEVRFYAYNFATGRNYILGATKVAEGINTYIYLEVGAYVSQAVIDELKNEFDNNIYGNVRAAFGTEPNPGVDGDPKMFILLLDIPDVTGGGTTVGYFDPSNELSVAIYPSTNLKEMLYVDSGSMQTVANLADVKDTMAHEFQHMIHWGLKKSDDTWLNEAMSEIARAFSGYGPSYDRAYGYQLSPSDSLTVWSGTVDDYGVVYMWAQYFYDHVGTGVFKDMLANSHTGIASVEAALTKAGYGKDFYATFRDWSVANFSGKGVQWPSHPEWSYKSLDLYAGTLSDGTPLPGLFWDPSKINATALASLNPWAVNYYGYGVAIGAPGTVTWTEAGVGDTATFIDGGNSTITFDIQSGTSYGYLTNGYLIEQNPTNNTTLGNAPASGAVAYTAAAAKTPGQLLLEAGQSATGRRILAETGKPPRICVQPYFAAREKKLRAAREKELRAAREGF